MDCNHSLGETIQYPDTTMACSIKQPENTFSSSFLKTYNQKGIFSQDFTVFFHYSWCISTPSLISHVLCFFSPEGNQIISPWSPEHPLQPLQTTPALQTGQCWGTQQGTSNFHTEFWIFHTESHRGVSAKLAHPPPAGEALPQLFKGYRRICTQPCWQHFPPSIPGKLGINAH